MALPKNSYEIYEINYNGSDEFYIEYVKSKVLHKYYAVIVDLRRQLEALRLKKD